MHNIARHHITPIPHSQELFCSALRFPTFYRTISKGTLKRLLVHAFACAVLFSILFVFVFLPFFCSGTLGGIFG